MAMETKLSASEMTEPSCENLNCNASQPSYNPFEVDICSLSLPACSPDVFSLSKKHAVEVETDPDNSFRWSIGQVAMLQPANLDEDVHQATIERWDDEKEYRAQKAIQTFFLHNSVCPSPWNGAMNFKHVSFSPHLASTAYFSRSNSPFSGQCDASEAPKTKDAWTQTTLALPSEIDIFQLLGQFYTFLDDQWEQKLSEENDLFSDAKDSGNSSLRRKLFSPSRYQKDGYGTTGSAPLGDSPLKFCTPEKGSQRRFQQSPSTAGTYFSSSPIALKNCSLSPLQMEHNLSSPTVSPILTDKQKKTIRKEPCQERWLPTTPCTKKGACLKSMQLPTGDEPRNSDKELAVAFQSAKHRSSGSMASVTSKEATEELQMEDDTRYDISENSDMQVSVIQFSSDEKACMQSTGISTFNPSSVISQDTGYKTESYQFSLDNGISVNINESKEKMVHHWLSHDCNVTDRGAMDEMDDFKHRHAETNNYADSVLMSQSSWHPRGFSTPH